MSVGDTVPHKMTFDDTIRAAVLARFEEEVAFLAALVRHPSDNPPGDCAPHAEVTPWELDHYLQAF